MDGRIILKWILKKQDVRFEVLTAVTEGLYFLG
jgi:hypothetical protein